jgi:hypothetical protein
MMKRFLPLCLLLISSAALAESGAYRVEVIVFRNLAVTVEPAPIDELRSFSQFPALEENDLPDDLVALVDKSSYMDGVWRRLRSSKGYRPLIFAAWMQNRTDYYPPMRVHDELVLDTGLRPPTEIMVADLAAEDPLSAYRSTFYRLDGTVQLKRSRFLHLYLDLEYRETSPADEASSASETQASFFNTEEAREPGAGTDAGYSVFHLKQNRQIRTGQMQYFDTPFFGALVYVTPVAAETTRETGQPSSLPQ